MQSASIVDRLGALATFASVPRNELEWLVSRGELRTIEAGTVFNDNAVTIEEMSVVIEGRLGLYVGPAGAKRKVTEAEAGQVVGVMPYSRFRKNPGVAIVEETVTVLVLHERHFPAMAQECHQLTTALVHYMLDRAREFRAIQMNDERLQSLSRLASGFAHELNNPASAATRTARSLGKLLDQEERAARELAATRLTDEQLAAVDAVRIECGRDAKRLSVLDAAEREDELADWLARHGIEAGAAESLAASDVTMASLEKLASTLPRAAVGIATRWIASRCAARTASRQIEAATGRIHDLVGAMKSFTFMDREGVPEPLDIARGLSDTVALLEGKARAKSVTLQLETSPDLPRINGFGSELNQVWDKLVDNAVDAVGDRGNVNVTASSRGDAIVVRIADDGPGIPEEIQSRIFDPFFTTKAVGHAGLGLDIARRVIHQHNGDIEFSTQPGRTVFRVRLPLSGVPMIAKA